MVLLPFLRRVQVGDSSGAKSRRRARNRRSTGPNEGMFRERALVDVDYHRNVRGRRAGDASGSYVLRAFVRPYYLCFGVRRRDQWKRGRGSGDGGVFRVRSFTPRHRDGRYAGDVPRRTPVTRQDVLRVVGVRPCAYRCVGGRNAKVSSRRRRVGRDTRASNT